MFINAHINKGLPEIYKTTGSMLHANEDTYLWNH